MDQIGYIGTLPGKREEDDSSSSIEAVSHDEMSDRSDIRTKRKSLNHLYAKIHPHKGKYSNNVSNKTRPPAARTDASKYSGDSSDRGGTQSEHGESDLNPRTVREI